MDEHNRIMGFVQSLVKCGFDSYVKPEKGGKRMGYVDPAHVIMIADKDPGEKEFLIKELTARGLYERSFKVLSMDTDLMSCITLHPDELKNMKKKIDGSYPNLILLNYDGKMILASYDPYINDVDEDQFNRKIAFFRVFNNGRTGNYQSVFDGKILSIALSFLGDMRESGNISNERVLLYFGDDHPLFIRTSRFDVFVAPTQEFELSLAGYLKRKMETYANTETFETNE